MGKALSCNDFFSYLQCAFLYGKLCGKGTADLPVLSM